MIIRILLGSMAALWLCATAARADTAQILQDAAAQYRQGRVLDAEATLQTALKSASAPADRWRLADLLTDICTYSFDYRCIDTNLTTLGDAAAALNAPQRTAAKMVFVFAFREYLRGNSDFFRQNGLDFSLKIANPLADPALATRLFLLNAAVLQQTGDFGAAHRMIDRAFASFLRIDYGQDGFETATLMKALISAALANHDAARALHWALIADPIIRAGLSPASFDYADYRTVTAEIAETMNKDDPALGALNLAMAATAKLQIAPELKDDLLSMLAINQAAIYGLKGDATAMQERLAADPYFARRDGIIARGSFSSFDEESYAAAEIFFDALAHKTPDPRWKLLFEKIPTWTFGADRTSESRIYAKVALALLTAKSDAGAARRMFQDAARESVATFERGRDDAKAFPLPSLLDRIMLTIALGSIPPQPEGADADLLLGGLELLDRNPRYVISDTLAALSAQDNDEARHAAHALLRLSDHQQDWEARQLQALAARMSAHQAFPARDFAPQIAAQNFADSLARLAKGVKPPPARLPRLAELQTALAPDEAFIGIVQGLRVCVRRNGIWDSRMVYDFRQLPLDVKLLSAALSSQNAPSEKLDSQYPVAAAMRLYHLLFDDLGPCLQGVHQLIYFPPGDVAAIPLAALLKDEPPRTASGHDLSQAHWLILDYAVSTVTSIRDFLSSRSLSQTLARRQDGTLAFAGIGDPKLRGVTAPGLKDLPELPETRTEVETIAHLFKNGTDLRLGQDATEEKFRSLPLDQYRILHFATHGLMQGDIDGLSQAALVFTPEDANNIFDDGLLTAGDVANLNLAARLVVLSACNTANFDPTIFTSQLQGLASAFAAAGAPTTVAALWSVNDETGLKLMVRFYRTLLGDSAPTVAMALQRAMIETLHEAPSPAFANPRFWAPFIVMGDGGAVIAGNMPAPRRKSLVEVSPGGGEIMAMTASEGGLISSEIGPMAEGRASSLIRKRNAGAIAWTLEDKQIGSGALAAGKDASFAAGTIWRGRMVPVLRAVSKSGALLWQKELASRFDSAAIASLTPGADGLYAVIAPMNETAGRIDFDLVRLDSSGREIVRRAVTTALPDAQMHLDRTLFATALMDGSLYISASHSPVSASTGRSDFGFPALCYQGRGAHIYKVNAADLSAGQDNEIPDLQIRDLKALRDGLLFAGSAQLGCAWNGERALFGHLGADLKSRIDWQDEGVFYGHLTGIAPVLGGYAAIGDVAEPLDIVQPARAPDAAAKYLDASDASRSESVLIRFDDKGGVREKIFLGNGLPEYSQGLVRTGPDAYVVYGSDGFNPWLETVN